VNLEGFRRDILSEPAALAGLAEAYHAAGSPLDALPDLSGRRILFIGMGSSKFAADTVVALLRSHGVDAHAELASSVQPQPAAADTVAIVVSNSGSSEETVAALRRHTGTSLVVGVTNRPERVVGAEADVCLPLLAEEEGGIACKSYQATLAVLLLVAGRILATTVLSREQLDAAAESQAELLETREAWLPPLTELAEGGLGVWVAAPDRRIGSARQSALMLREAPRIVADACETGDWLHVDVYLTKRPGYRMLLLPGSPYDPGVIHWRQERGFCLVSVGRELDGVSLAVPFRGAEDDLVAMLVETSVSELLAAELWQRHPI
jgi:fructoselysine-6-P-deglycase FrlB-like protein